MLRIQTDEQREKIAEILKDVSIAFCPTNDGINIDDYVSFDQMALIVDCLRAPIDSRKDLFEECWVAYRRKGVKKKAYEYWKKLSDAEKQNVLPHIKAYVSARDLQYQKDFERYLRDKVFSTIVFNGNKVVYDPTKFDSGKYTPQGSTIWFDERTQSYWTTTLYFDFGIDDGYSDNDRPDGATLTLNNARGKVKWSKENKRWLTK